MLSGKPSEPVTTPPALARLAGTNPVEWVWRNEVGGLTMRILDGTSTRYAKWSPRSSGFDLAEEVARLRWVTAYARVPQVIDAGADEEGTWFVSLAIDAANAVTSPWREDPRRATEVIGKGLRILHDTLPVSTCPFSWSRRERLDRVEQRYAEGQLTGHEFPYELAGLTVDRAMAILRDAPQDDDVVCHGDACAPNTLLDAEGRYAGHVDFGCLGVGDRWGDLAIAAWSAVWNYGPRWERPVFESYGLEPDADKVRYYRLLWDLD